MSNFKFLLCNSSQYLSPYSSRRDVVLLYGSSYHKGLVLAIKSLRMTGCQARIVLFTGRQSDVQVLPEAFAKEMSVEVVGNLTNPYNVSEVPHMIRYNFERMWLTSHAEEVDRIIHTDAYDVFFQSDPFFEATPDTDLLFTLEPHAIRSCGWNLAWFGECYGPELTEVLKDNFIVCSGSIAGGAKAYIALLNLMTNLPEWRGCYGPSHDQPILNWLIWTGALANAGVPYRFGGCDSGFMTIQWCVLNHDPMLDERGRVLSPSGRVPSYLHQYTRIDELRKHLSDACGVF